MNRRVVVLTMFATIALLAADISQASSTFVNPVVEELFFPFGLRSPNELHEFPLLTNYELVLHEGGLRLENKDYSGALAAIENAIAEILPFVRLVTSTDPEFTSLVKLYRESINSQVDGVIDGFYLLKPGVENPGREQGVFPTITSLGKAYYDRGLAHYFLGEYEAAITDFNEALRVPSAVSVNSILIARAATHQCARNDEQAHRDYLLLQRLLEYDRQSYLYFKQHVRMDGWEIGLSELFLFIEQAQIEYGLEKYQHAKNSLIEAKRVVNELLQAREVYNRPDFGPRLPKIQRQLERALVRLASEQH